MSASNLRYLSHQDIDKKKWDACIRRTPHGLIYALAVYLDHMCAGWDAVIAGDYEGVIPLPHRKKYGIRYLFIPPFIQQLGFIGQFNPDDYQAALDLIYQRFSYGDLFLNASNSHVATGMNVRTNLYLDLKPDKQSITNRFSQDIKRNLKISKPRHYNIAPSSDFNEIVEHYQINYKKTAGVNKIGLELFKKLCIALEQDKMAHAYVCKDEKGQIDAAAILFTDEKRVYLVMNSVSEPGRMYSANHALIAGLIEKFAGRDLLFDFEGSDIQGIQYFFRGFGAEEEKYFFHHFNRLPFPLNLMKR